MLALKANDIEQFSIALTKLATPLNVEQRKKIKSATKAKRIIIVGATVTRLIIVNCTTQRAICAPTTNIRIM